MESDGSCCSDKLGRGLRLLQHRPQQEAGNRVESDGSCCSDKIRRGLRLLQYRLSRRREIVWNRTEAAARTSSDVDFAFFSTALSRRREIARTRTRTWTCTWTCFKTGQNGDSRRTLPSSPSRHHPFLLLPFSPTPTSRTPTNVTRGDDGAPGQGPPAEKSSPAACRQGHWNHSRCCPCVEKNFSGTQRHSLAAGSP